MSDEVKDGEIDDITNLAKYEKGHKFTEKELRAFSRYLNVDTGQERPFWLLNLAAKIQAEGDELGLFWSIVAVKDGIVIHTDQETIDHNVRKGKSGVRKIRQAAVDMANRVDRNNLTQQQKDQHLRHLTQLGFMNRGIDDGRQQARASQNLSFNAIKRGINHRARTHEDEDETEDDD